MNKGIISVIVVVIALVVLGIIGGSLVYYFRPIPNKSQTKAFPLSIKAGVPKDFAVLKFTEERGGEKVENNEFATGESIGLASANTSGKASLFVKIYNDKNEVAASGNLSLAGSDGRYCCIPALSPSGTYVIQVFKGNQTDGSFPLMLTVK